MAHIGALEYVTSKDGVKWGQPSQVASVRADEGLQMTTFNGRIYGVVTYDDTYLAVTKYAPGAGWHPARDLPEKFRAYGRVAVAALHDRFYVVYRGTNNGVYLVYTEDFKKWVDCGRVGSKYAQAEHAPAITASGDGLVITAAAKDLYIYWTSVDYDGKRTASWKKIDGTGTRSDLASASYKGDVYLFHCAYNDGSFFYQTFDADKQSWSSLNKVVAPRIAGGPIAATFNNKLYLSYRAPSYNIEVRGFDGKNWSAEDWVKGGVYIMYHTGMAGSDDELVISFGKRSKSTSQYRYRSPRLLNEKSAFVSEQEVSDDEWDVKWNQKTNNKSWLRKFFPCL